MSKRKVPGPVVWNEPDKQRLVLYMDIMGFKNLLASASHAEMGKLLESFTAAMDKQTLPLVGTDIRMSRFSDSILCVTEKADDAALNKLTKTAIRLMQIGMRSGFPLRGAIAMGNMTYDESHQLYFGQSLVDAYLLEEELMYYGVIVHHTAEKLVKDNLPTQPYVEIPALLKSGTVPHYQLAWHHLDFSLSPKNIELTIFNQLEDMKLKVSSRPRQYIANTVEVLKAMTAKHTINP